jgi:hypothetical protein
LFSPFGPSFSSLSPYHSENPELQEGDELHGGEGEDGVPQLPVLRSVLLVLCSAPFSPSFSHFGPSFSCFGPSFSPLSPYHSEDPELQEGDELHGGEGEDGVPQLPVAELMRQHRHHL